MVLPLSFHLAYRDVGDISTVADCNNTNMEHVFVSEPIGAENK